MGKPLYVASESYKFVRMYPLVQEDLPIEQNIVKFETNVEQDPGEVRGDIAKGEPVAGGRQIRKNYFPVHDTTAPSPDSNADAVDYTPPHLISALITENGILTPAAVSEEVIKLWF
jgi:translation initiation factor eIF-2B subunit alpha